MRQHYYKWVLEAIAHIEANLGEAINVPEVAEAGGVFVLPFRPHLPGRDG